MGPLGITVKESDYGLDLLRSIVSRQLRGMGYFHSMGGPHSGAQGGDRGLDW